MLTREGLPQECDGIIFRSTQKLSGLLNMERESTLVISQIVRVRFSCGSSIQMTEPSDDYCLLEVRTRSFGSGTMEVSRSESNKVLSEVHLHGSSSSPTSEFSGATHEEYYLTRFVFKIPSFSRSEDDFHASDYIQLYHNKLEESPQIKTDSVSDNESNSNKNVRVDSSRGPALVEVVNEKSVITPYEDADGDMILTRKRRYNPSEQGDEETCFSAECSPQGKKKADQQISDPAIELEAHINTSQTEVLTIEHKMSTEIPEVGFQVWCGALLMCDYLLYKEKDFQSLRVLDLGAGTGITSIVAAMLCSNVVCTDFSIDILKLAERNWIRNKDCLPGCDASRVQFCLLDWTQDFPFLPGTSESADASSFVSQDFREPQLLIAAEVIYDVELTDAFFRTIYHFLSTPPEKLLLVTLEKRIVFSAECHVVCSPAYKQFRENVEDLASIDEGRVRFSVEQIPANFPKYFDYSRLKELELWKISSHFPV